MKKISLIAIAMLSLLAIQSCNISSTDQSHHSEAETVMISQLLSEPLLYEDQLVRIEGIIGHMCRNSGDKMRVNQFDDHGFSIMVMLGDFSANFSPEFEGKEIVATGILKAEVRNMSALDSHDHDHDHEDGHECASTAEAIKMLEERGIIADVRTFLELTSFEIK